MSSVNSTTCCGVSAAFICMMVAKLDIAVSQILDCHDGLFGSIQALHLLVLLKAAAGDAISRKSKIHL